MVAAGDDPPLVEIAEGSKSYGATRALSRVDFAVHAGEVHVLAGENGAGKSTLIRILSGAVTEFEGTLRIAGRPVRFRGPEDAAAAGIATIHQELSLVGSMSIADNLLAGIDRGSLFGLLDRPARQRRARQMLQDAGLDLVPSLPVEALTLSDRQLLEIARALARAARVIVMDEPTSALSEAEAERLFDRIDELRAAGRGIVYISHRLEEIYRVADRITVLRDGRRIRTAPAAELGRDELVRAIAGRDLEQATAGPSTIRPDAPRLTVRQLRLADPLRAGRHRLDGVTLEVHAGEVLGIAGLRGSGHTDLLHGLFGSHGERCTATIEIDGEPAPIRSPADAIARGLMLLAADRAHSVVGPMSVAHNATLSSLGAVSRFGFLDHRAERSLVTAMIERLHIAVAAPTARAETLSGGNQQKVALARCLLTRPRILLLDEPTRGIDVGAKAEIYELVGRLVAERIAVLLVASELDELVRLSHRVLVLREGRQAALLAGSAIGRAPILAAAMGGRAEAAS